MFERHFVAYGVRIGLRVDCRALLDALEQDPECLDLPFGWRAVDDHEAEAPVSIRYQLRTDASCGTSPSFRLYAGTNLVAEAHRLTDVGWALAAHAEPFVAERAPDHLFVHAGVVGWEGRAIVMPGASFAGKSTLVQAWLEAGATYYSDEFAVLDRAGRVHPFARPLAIRDGSTGSIRRVSVAALGAETGTTPLPVGLILMTAYRVGARWRPRRLTPAPALLALMRNTVAARGNPAHSMPILKQAVSGGMAFAGPRGEARPMISAVLRQARSVSAFDIAATRSDLMYPRQSPTTHTEQLGDEASVYDWARGQVHALNPTAARVWRQCDGATSRDAIAAVLRVEMGIPEADAVVDLTLAHLARLHLLEQPVESRGDRSPPSRRWLIGRGLTAALLPAIYSIAAPSPVEAQSAGAARRR